jgi:hypothetical protein
MQFLSLVGHVLKLFQHFWCTAIAIFRENKAGKVDVLQYIDRSSGDNNSAGAWCGATLYTGIP